MSEIGEGACYEAGLATGYFSDDRVNHRVNKNSWLDRIDQLLGSLVVVKGVNEHRTGC